MHVLCFSAPHLRVNHLNCLAVKNWIDKKSGKRTTDNVAPLNTYSDRGAIFVLYPIVHSKFISSMIIILIYFPSLSFFFLPVFPLSLSFSVL